MGLLMNIALVIDVALYLRIPMEHVLRFEYNLVLINFVMKTVVTVMIFFCVAMFGGMCWDREWLLYPNYNYPSWSYGVAVFAMIINGVASFCRIWNWKSVNIPWISVYINVKLTKCTILCIS